MTTQEQLRDRWTVLFHDPRRETARGCVSESNLCVDCGVNTAPGLLTRKQLDVAFKIYGKDHAIEQTLTWDQEVYMLKKGVWRETGLEGWGGCLCIGCLEKRIGRRLKRGDFLARHPFNSPDFPASPRLRDRRGG